MLNCAPQAHEGLLYPMEIAKLHDWTMNYKSARQLQIELRQRLHLKPMLRPPKVIAGCDVSCKLRVNMFYSAVVILSYPEFKITNEYNYRLVNSAPYIPGLLSFREMPILIETWEMVQPIPDLVFCDGSGLIHPRKFGLACHLGLWLNLPTIGCAKNLLCGEHKTVGNKKGDWEPVIFQGETVGAAVRTRANTKPMYISPGNWITLEQSIEYVLKTTPKYRIPEPIRTAHISANRFRQEQKEQGF